MVALWKLRQNDFSTPNHANIETGRHLSFALSRVSIKMFSKEVAQIYKLNTLSKSLRCILFGVPPVFLTFFLSFLSPLYIILLNPLLPT